MNIDRKTDLIVGAGMVGKLAVGLGMDTARFAEVESNVHREAALRAIRSIRDELEQLEANLNGIRLPVTAAPRAA